MIYKITGQVANSKSKGNSFCQGRLILTVLLVFLSCEDLTQKEVFFFSPSVSLEARIALVTVLADFVMQTFILETRIWALAVVMGHEYRLALG